jgi:hypothetical protein
MRRGAQAINSGSGLMTAPTRGFEAIESSYDRIMEASVKIDLQQQQLEVAQQQLGELQGMRRAVEATNGAVRAVRGAIVF